MARKKRIKVRIKLDGKRLGTAKISDEEYYQVLEEGLRTMLAKQIADLYGKWDMRNELL